MKTKKRLIGILMLIGLLVGSLGAGAFLAGQPGRAAAAPMLQTTDPCAEDDDSGEAADTADLDDVEEEVECGQQDESEADEAGDMDVEDGHQDADTDESDEAAPADTGISADQAQAIVEAANSDTTTLAVEFDRENGHDIWEVELANGLDVKVDASNGQILGTETRD